MHSLRGVCFVFWACARGGFGGGLVRLLGRFLALFLVDLGHRPQQAFGQFLQFFVFRVERRAWFGPRCRTGSGGGSGCGLGRCGCRTGWRFDRGWRRCLGRRGGMGGWCRRRWCPRRRCRWGDHGRLRRGGLGWHRVCVWRVARCGRCSRARRSRHHGGRRRGRRRCAGCVLWCRRLSCTTCFGLGLGICLGPLRHGAWARACGRRGCCGVACCTGAGGLAWGHGRGCPLRSSGIWVKLRADVGANARQVNGAACHRYINGHCHRCSSWRSGCGWCRCVGGPRTHGHVREQQP